MRAPMQALVADTRAEREALTPRHWRDGLMSPSALMIETNGDWAVTRRCTSLETLARLTSLHGARLSALAA